MSSEIELQLAVSEADADAERLDQLTRRLTRGLRDLGVESVERPPGEAPPEDAKGDPFTLGTLALALVPALLPELVKFLRDWVQTRQGQTVKITTSDGVEVEFTANLTETELASLVEKITQAGRV